MCDLHLIVVSMTSFHLSFLGIGNKQFFLASFLLHHSGVCFFLFGLPQIPRNFHFHTSKHSLASFVVRGSILYRTFESFHSESSAYFGCYLATMLRDTALIFKWANVGGVLFFVLLEKSCTLWFGKQRPNIFSF